VQVVDVDASTKFVTLRNGSSTVFYCCKKCKTLRTHIFSGFMQLCLPWTHSLWNSLLSALRDSSWSLNTSKWQLKTHLYLGSHERHWAPL